METFYTVAGLIIIFAGTIYWFVSKYRKDKEKWQQMVNDSYLRGQDDANEMMESTFLQTEKDQENWTNLSEKELLIQIMRILGSYGRRLDRLDNKVKCISNYKIYIDEINTQAQTISQNISEINENFSITLSHIDNLSSTVQKTDLDIQSFLLSLRDLNDLQTKLDNHILSLRKAENIISALQENMDIIITESDNIVNAYEQSPMKKLNEFEAYLQKLDETASDTNSSIDVIEKNVSMIWNFTHNIQSATFTSSDEIFYGTIFKRLDTLSDTVNDLSNYANKLHDQVQEMQSAISRSFDQYGYDSLYQKLDSILTLVQD